MAAPSHTITVTINRRPVTAHSLESEISVDGNCDPDHFLLAFRFALQSAGYLADFAAGLSLDGHDEPMNTSAGCTD